MHSKFQVFHFSVTETVALQVDILPSGEDLLWSFQGFFLLLIIFKYSEGRK